MFNDLPGDAMNNDSACCSGLLQTAFLNFIQWDSGFLGISVKLFRQDEIVNCKVQRLMEARGSIAKRYSFHWLHQLKLSLVAYFGSILMGWRSLSYYEFCIVAESQ